MGWAAALGEVTLVPLLPYFGGIAWTLGYDTIYAHQDKEDDSLIGIKSSALALGDKTQPWLWVFYGFAVACFAAAGALAGTAWPFYAGLAAATLFFIWHSTRVKINDAAGCLQMFKLNFWVGAAVFAGIVAARAIG